MGTKIFATLQSTCMQRIFLFLLIFWTISSTAQKNKPTLSEADFLAIVLAYHPLATQADIRVDLAKTDILTARGNFDPLVEYSSNQKDVEGIRYYNYQNTSIKIPTWYGIYVYSGIEQADGERINTNETPGQLGYIGLSFPVLKNLLLDKRRAALMQSKIIAHQTEAERKVALNDLLMEAVSKYWSWVKIHRKLEIINKVVTNNRLRLDLTKRVIQLGERPAIDSIEVLTQLQYWLNLEIEMELERQQALIQLSAYTWDENQRFIDLPNTLIPETPSFLANELQIHSVAEIEYLEEAKRSHPEIEMNRQKIEYYVINKRLAKQNLLPTLDVKYHQLSKNYTFSETISQPLFQQNFRYGVAFELPLRLSAERANFKRSKLKLIETNNDLSLKQRWIETKIKENFAALQTLRKQITLQSELLNNQNTLLNGEEVKFQNGESSLFLINSREQKVMETEQKVVENIASYYAQINKVKWASGVLWKLNKD
jgi:outer membrane protein TolC